MGQFAQQLQKFSDKTKARVDVVVKQVVIDVANSVIVKSPAPIGDPTLWKKKPSKNFLAAYDPGKFVANWTYGLGEINYTTTTETQKDRLAQVEQISEQIPAKAGGKIHYITNSLPYAMRLEEGHSKQPLINPGGMVARTVIEFKDIVKGAARVL